MVAPIRRPRGSPRAPARPRRAASPRGWLRPREGWPERPPGVRGGLLQLTQRHTEYLGEGGQPRVRDALPALPSGDLVPRDRLGAGHGAQHGGELPLRAAGVPPQTGEVGAELAASLGGVAHGGPLQYLVWPLPGPLVGSSA